MLRNYIKIAFRNLIRNKVYSFINIAGLAMGITAFLLILEYVSFEKSVNQFHTNLPNMYRLLNQGPTGETWPQVEPGWAAKAKQNFPEIKEYCRYTQGIAQGIVRKEGTQNESFREANINYAEGNFFEFFSFPLLDGQKLAFKQPNVVFVSQKTAIKYFGKENPIDRTLIVSNQFGTTPYTVKGVYEFPENSDIQDDMLLSLETLANPANLNGNDWAQLDNLGSQFINTCFLLNNGTDFKALEKKMTAFRTTLKKDKDGGVFRLQAFTNIHLAASLNDTYQTSGNLKYVYMLAAIAFLILLIAWFNYINLSTANALKRANEVGVRKVIGATSNHLIGQFLGESCLVTSLGLALSLLLISILQPFFNQLIGKTLSLYTLFSSSIWIVGLSVLGLGSLLAGAYTAFALSNYNPVETLKGKITKTAKGVFLRKSLVVSQFSISVALILVTVLIYSQLRFMQTQNLGINTQQLLVVRGPEFGIDSTFQGRKTTFIREIAQQSFVKDYCQSGSIPGSWYNFSTSGFTSSKSKLGDELKSYSFAIVGERYFNTYEIPLKAGRNFTEAECNVAWNDNSKVVLNEKAMELLGFKSAEEAIRSKIKWDERYLEIIGVVKDYHHTGLQRAIDPIIFYPQNSSAYFTVRLSPLELQKKIAKLENLYQNAFAGNPFEYYFVDEHFNQQYISEKQYSELFTTASIWAIFIACMGLFGLATFTVETRTKEIGIRKVLGASVLGIIALLSKDFLKLVLISIFIASPVAWYFMAQWLQDFAYHIEMEWWVFVATAILAVFVALITVGFQAIKAAFMNPVKSLKSE